MFHTPKTVDKAIDEMMLGKSEMMRQFAIKHGIPYVVWDSITSAARYTECDRFVGIWGNLIIDMKKVDGVYVPDTK